MSSFKRKSTSKQPFSILPGTRISPSSSSTLITSTGISSLDDILGGGLPLSCSLIIAAPDVHSSYGLLVQKYFIAQGLASGHRVCVVGRDAESFVRDAMWFPSSNLNHVVVPEEDEDDEEQKKVDDKVKIAWRYENMGQFKTTTTTTAKNTTDSFCAPFELTSVVPDLVLKESACRLQFLDPQPLSLPGLLAILSNSLKFNRDIPLRICIPALGSPLAWGDQSPQSILYFMLSLRAVLREHPHGCASICLPPQLSTSSCGGPGWMQKVGWASDGALTMSAFTADPALSSAFPTHHGILEIHTLPAPHTLIPPSDRFSALRGLASSGENNLAFRCTRKRLMFETLHLDVEGGTSERRTTPSANAVTSVSAAHPAVHKENKGEVGLVNIEIEGGGEVIEVKDEVKEGMKKLKKKKRVLFEPDPYDY